MITDADIKKMKAVFATKEDIKLLSNKFEAKFATKDEMNDGFINMDKKIDNLSDRLQKNTEDLIELITTGFDSLEKSSSRINEYDSILDDHEKRIERIEEKAFKAN